MKKEWNERKEENNNKGREKAKVKKNQWKENNVKEKRNEK
jgi:hypothetical protein